jgi:lipopolysaccharide export system protein LptA
MKMLLFCAAVAGFFSLALVAAGAPEVRPDAGGDSLKGRVFGTPKPVDIRSETLTVFHKDRYGIFKGKVVADRKDVQLYCDELRAEYDEGGQVQRLVCSGKVRVIMGHKEARGAKAVFENEKELITMTGDPMLIDGEDVMKGEIVYFNLADDTVQVEKPIGRYRTKPGQTAPGQGPPAKGK